MLDGIPIAFWLMIAGLAVGAMALFVMFVALGADEVDE